MRVNYRHIYSMKGQSLLIIFSIWANILSAQEAVDVTDQTIKITAFSERELLFGFAAGDKIIFNFEEENNKELKEIQIIEYPNNSKFSDFKTRKIENKVFSVNKQSILIFKFKNEALGGRICKIKIQRIPASENTKNFNCAVSWVTKQDTTWNSYTKDVIIGYDTTYQKKTRRELVRSEQREEQVFEKNQRVHSTSNSNGNKTSFFFTLPNNQITTYEHKKVISWAYWIGVGDEANEAWQKNVKAIGQLVKNAASAYTTPLGAFAIGAVTELMSTSIGEDVSYYVVDELNKNLFHQGVQFYTFDHGKGVTGYRKFTDQSLCQGMYHICLSNDNVMMGINTTVKVSAIIQTDIYEDKTYVEEIVNPKFEKQLFKDPVINTYNMPVTGQ